MIKFQQSQALTSHFESFWSIVRYVPFKKGPLELHIYNIHWLDFRASEERTSQRRASRKLSTSSINLEESQTAESTSRTQLRKKSSSLTRVSAAQSNTMLIQGSAEKVNII